jgi:hypothetical protein
VRFLSPAECEAWCHARGFPVAEGEPTPSFPDPIEFQIPSDSGRRVALSRLLWASLAQQSPESLLWVTQYGVWPSGQHRPLADSARAAWGATAPIREQPGHLVLPGESDDGLSVLVLAALFLWDVWLLPGGAQRAVHLSHDEFGIAWFAVASERAAFERKLQSFLS